MPSQLAHALRLPEHVRLHRKRHEIFTPNKYVDATPDNQTNNNTNADLQLLIPANVKRKCIDTSADMCSKNCEQRKQNCTSKDKHKPRQLYKGTNVQRYNSTSVQSDQHASAPPNDNMQRTCDHEFRKKT